MPQKPAPTEFFKRLPQFGIRLDFDLEAFEAAIENHGVNALWERAAACPCKNNDQTGQPKHDCPVCNGAGWEYHGAQVIRILIGALDLDRDTQMAYGMTSRGMAMITVPSVELPDFRDRFTNLDTILRYTERRERKHAAGTLEPLRYYIGRRDDLDLYPVKQPLGYIPPPDESGYVAQAARAMAVEAASRTGEPAPRRLDVFRLRLMDRATNTPGRVLEQGVDFEARDGKIDFRLIDTREPGAVPVGATFGVSYLYHPRYLVTRFDHAARDQYGNPDACNGPETFQRMPVQVHALLDYMLEGGA